MVAGIFCITNNATGNLPAADLFVGDGVSILALANGKTFYSAISPFGWIC